MDSCLYKTLLAFYDCGKSYILFSLFADWLATVYCQMIVIFFLEFYHHPFIFWNLCYNICGSIKKDSHDVVWKNIKRIGISLFEWANILVL